jgi:histidinol-phosphate/aromatic aminotransferase/cobyric acid decarboxylase-like protein
VLRRPVWLAAGVVVGVGGTLWAERRVRAELRRAADRLSPSGLGQATARSAARAGARMTSAVDAAREGRARREAELRRELGLGPRALDGAPPGR